MITEELIAHGLCSQAIRLLIPAFEISPSEINDGMCGLFSHMIVERLGGPSSVIYESFTDGIDPGHCWITCFERHFDAECPEGVDDPHDLPWFKRTGIQLEE